MKLRGRRVIPKSAAVYLLALAAAAAATSAPKNKVTAVTVKDYSDYTAVTVKLEKPDVFKVTKMKDGRLALVIANCEVSPAKAKSEKKIGAVKKVTAETKNKEAWVYITLTEIAKSYEGKTIKTPAQIFFKIYKKPPGSEKGKPVAAEEKYEPTTAKGEFPTSAKDVPADTTPTIIDTICIDPGHGGHFTGAEGPRGVVEKDVNLDISLRLARLLRDKLNCRVVMTRVDDSHVYMRDRTALANAVKADLFVDIHNNAVLNAKVGGTETYFLSTTRADWERAATLAENEDWLAENPNFTADAGTLNFLLAALAQNEFLQESSDLAHFVQEKLVATLGRRDRGVKQAPFYVLVGCQMPSILVEVAFISNPEEEKLLTDPSWQQKAAEAIFEGIKAYKEAYEKKVNKGRQ